MKFRKGNEGAGMKLIYKGEEYSVANGLLILALVIGALYVVSELGSSAQRERCLIGNDWVCDANGE